MDIFFNTEIENFLLISEYGSLSAVSRRTGQDVGSLSRSLMKLENELGHSLFIRLNTGLTLNQEGVKLQAAIKAGKQSFQTELSNFSTNKIRIGFSGPVGFSYFQEEHLKLLHELKLSPEFQIFPTMILFEMLKARELDLIFSPKKVTFPECINSPVASDKIVLVSTTGKLTNTILYNNQMIEVENALKKIKFDQLWEIKDYFVLGKFLVSDKHLMGLLPFSLLEFFPSLKVIKEFSHVGKIQAITWKGSVGAEYLKALKKT